MKPEIDHSLYPDMDAPESLAAESDAADYLVRVCGAYDFGIPPSDDVIETLRGLRVIFDKYPLPASPGYHALRHSFGWPVVPPLAVGELRFQQLDRREGREPDPILI